MRQIFLPKSHPEAGTFDSREIFHQRFKLFVVNHIRFFRTNLRIIQWFMNFVWFSFHPLSVFPVFPALRNLTDINFRIEVGSKSFTMITGITVHNIQIMNFVEVMFGCISSVNAGYSGIESTTQNSR